MISGECNAVHCEIPGITEGIIADNKIKDVYESNISIESCKHCKHFFVFNYSTGNYTYHRICTVCPIFFKTKGYRFKEFMLVSNINMYVDIINNDKKIIGLLINTSFYILNKIIDITKFINVKHLAIYYGRIKVLCVNYKLLTL